MKNILLLVVLNSSVIYGQHIPKGKYIGYENMYFFKSGYYFPGIYVEQEMDTTKAFHHSDKWFHEVTFDVISDSCVNISKIPVYINNDKVEYTNKWGEFLYYNCSKVIPFDSSFCPELKGKVFISGSLTACPNCKYSGTAVPRLVYCKYDVDTVTSSELILWTEFGRKIYKRKK